MFDNNKKVSVGRDVNINLVPDLQNESEAGLIKLSDESKLVLKTKLREKRKKAFRNWIIFFAVTLSIYLFVIPYMLAEFADSEYEMVSSFFSSLRETILKKPEIKFIISISTALLPPVWQGLFVVWSTSSEEEKEEERIKEINEILERRKILNK